MKKVLIINTIGFGFEGISSVILNYISKMDLSDLQLDFVTFNDSDKYIIKILEDYGSVFVIPDRKEETSGYIKSFRQLLREHKYDVVHINGNSGTMLIEAALSKVYGVKNIIVHTHSTHTDHKYISMFFKLILNNMNITRLGCSKEACDNLYGNHGYTVLKNAIDYNRFSYNPELRKKIRDKFNIKNEKVIGHCGHFTGTKNHEFILEVFETVHEKAKDTILMLISDGPRMNDIQKKVTEMNLTDSVIFVGRVNNSEVYYQAMDLFLFPSKWEGFGLVAIEAQVSGLPVIASKGVPQSTKISDNIEYLSLNENIQLWADKIIDCLNNLKNRSDIDLRKNLTDVGLNIDYEVDILKRMYLNN